ncbi:MAG: precorrin-6y C5,15-methyltransferase (decarboxylating) subunit CbiE [Deltaproteobacteria bacterium]|nr:precorrin-6y C5,15-methyltransferase (decarboxylating) subunit CbiE [Deltaproteobacteria bacterium]
MIYVIGIGISGRPSLAPAALEIIGRARGLAGASRHLAEFADFAGAKRPITADLDGLSRFISSVAKKGDVAVLATGDPLIYGVADFMIRRFGKAAVRIIPNVSVVQEAFALIKESANGVFITSAHGRRGLANLVDAGRRNAKLAILTDGVNTPAVIAREFLRGGAGGFDVYVCESIGMKAGRVRKGTLESVARMRRFHPLNTMILIRTASFESMRQRRIGIPDAAFRHRPGMITKEEIRVIALAKLDISEDSVIWDIGSCSGSVAIEAARLAPLGSVHAIEKSASRVRDIRANMRSLNAANVHVICASAPQCLTDKAMPPPDAVFVGGGGAKVGAILAVVARRAKPGARVVATAVTIETASVVTGFFNKRKWPVETTLVNLAKTRRLGDLNMLGAYNPVFVINARRPY